MIMMCLRFAAFSLLVASCTAACTVPYYNAVGLTVPLNNTASAEAGPVFFEQIQVSAPIQVSAIALYPVVNSTVAATSPLLNITAGLYSGPPGLSQNLTLIVQSAAVVVTDWSTFTQATVLTPLLFVVPQTNITAGAYNVVFWFTWNSSTPFYQSSFGTPVAGPPPLYFVSTDQNGGITYTNNQGVLPKYFVTSSNVFSGSDAPGAVVSLISNCSSTSSASSSSSSGNSGSAYVYSSSTGNSAATTTTQSISAISLLTILLALTYVVGF